MSIPFHFLLALVNLVKNATLISTPYDSRLFHFITLVKFKLKNTYKKIKRLHNMIITFIHCISNHDEHNYGHVKHTTTIP